ncbi:MAG: exonuclease SbcCD subunit D C-terminal domain-containing protein [Candidatus Muiribacteriota bacterium]
MKILHTSDWHLGRSILGRKRYNEFESFLDWLYENIILNNIDILIVAGDVFDTTTPGNYAQELYYRFLFRVSNSCCRHVVIIGGNHDSPSFLNAPAELLKSLKIYVVGSIDDSPENEVICLENNGILEAIICAVPYLRDKDIRTSEPGETFQDENRKLIAGMKTHYAEVSKIAERKLLEYSDSKMNNVPIIATGHLFAAGSQTVDGDGVRELYVGSLLNAGKDIFPDIIDYVALGHLHIPQVVGGINHIRYSGSPLSMGFSEKPNSKKVIIIEFNNDGQRDIQELKVPCFQELINISGSINEIKNKINELKKNKKNAWVQVEYTDKEIIVNLKKIIEEMIEKSSLEVLRIKNNSIKLIKNNQNIRNESLNELNPEEIFQRCMDYNQITENDQKELIDAYKQVIKFIQEEDINKS